MQKIVPHLWFNGQLEEALTFYTSIFEDARILDQQSFDDGGPDGKSQVMTATFELAGQRFMGLNAASDFRFTEAVSFFVNCEDQAEVDHFWSKLTADGGTEQPCGWVKDKFGLSWQIVPTRLGELLGDSDPERAHRAMQAMLQMKKIDISGLEAAAAG